MERYIAVDGVCAWPNMTRLSEGELGVAIYNQPVHGRWHGDVEAWVSVDGGRRWERRGVAAAGEPPGNRMNVAAGASSSGDWIVVSSGWSPVLAPGTEDPNFAFLKRHVLPPRVCRSADSGRTWDHADSVVLPNKENWYIPFGDVVVGDKGLGMSMYSCAPEGGPNSAWFFRSNDDGKTWGEASLIAADDYNETDLLHLGQGKWLAVCRTLEEANLQLFYSADDGDTWSDRGPLSLARQHPGHLTKLADGRVLLSYGLRTEGQHGVAVRISPDEGNSWGPPRTLVHLDEPTDCGYPSSSQLDDGTIVTAYYSRQIPQHTRYHMGVLRWPTPQIE